MADVAHLVVSIRHDARRDGHIAGSDQGRCCGIARMSVIGCLASDTGLGAKPGEGESSG